MNRWTLLADAIAEALEIKNPDEGIYGKRDWALVRVLEQLRDVAIHEATRTCGVELDHAAVRCELGYPRGTVRLVCPASCKCTIEDQQFMREAERAITRYLRAKHVGKINRRGHT